MKHTELVACPSARAENATSTDALAISAARIESDFLPGVNYTAGNDPERPALNPRDFFWREFRTVRLR